MVQRGNSMFGLSNAELVTPRSEYLCRPQRVGVAACRDRVVAQMMVASLWKSGLRAAVSR
jgi:hypothetical protein